MGAPDIASWIWPDASQGRAPTSAVKLDRSNPLLAGLADYIIPADPSSYSVAAGTVAQKYDLLGPAFAGTMRLDGKKSAVTTSAPYTLICIARMPATLSGTLVACSLEGSFTSSDTPWMGYDSGTGVVVSNSQADTGVAATANALYVICGVYTTTGYTAYINGVSAGTVSSGPSTGTTATLCVMDYNGGGFSYTGNVLGAMAFNRALSPGEIGALGTPQAVFSLFQPQKLGIYMPASGGGTITGTGASTQAANASSATGSVTVSGASASTQQANTSAAAGSVSASGAAASTQAGNTSSASGQVSVSGSAASTQVRNTSAAVGTVGVSGAAASNQVANSSAASGSVAITGTAASTQAPNTSNASGAIGNVSQGSGASTQAPNVSVASGAVGVTGSAASTQGKNASAASGAIAITGAAASVQSPNTSNASGSVGAIPVTGSAASTQAKNVSLAVGTVGVIGTASSTQQPNTSTASGISGNGSIGSAASTQAPNVSSGIGWVLPASTDPTLFPVGAETRVFGVDAEDRTFGVASEARIFGAAA